MLKKNPVYVMNNFCLRIDDTGENKVFQSSRLYKNVET